MLGRVPFHPLAVAATMVAVVWAANATEVTARMTVPSFLAVTAVAVVIWGVVAALLRDGRRGAVVASTLLVVVLGWGNVLPSSGPLAIGGAVVALAATVVVTRRLRRIDDAAVTSVNGTLNALAALVLVGAGVIVVVEGTGAPPAVAEAVAPVDATGSGRDVVWIVPDRYGGPASLAAAFGTDDGGFGAALRERGFVVAEDARANYPRTAMSLAAQFNLDTLDDAVEAMGIEAGASITSLYPLLDDHAVGRLFTSGGYEYTHVGSWWGPTASAAAADDVRRAGAVSEFWRAVEAQTVAPVLGVSVGGLPVERRPLHVVTNRFALDELDRIARELAEDLDDGPRLVIAHLLLPHPPYVFDADGRVLSAEEARERTTAESFDAQLAHLNDRLLDVVDVLVSPPDDVAPIVLIQADEGPHPVGYDSRTWGWDGATPTDLVTKLSILSAVRVPGAPDAVELEPGVTAVTVAQRVVEVALGVASPPIADRSYVYPAADDLYRFEDVTAVLDAAVGDARDG